MKTASKKWMSGVLFALAMTLAVAASANDEGPNVSVDFSNASMHDVADYLAVRAGVNIVVEKGVAGAVNLKLNDVSWLDTLTLASNQVGCSVEKGDGNIYFVSTPHFSFTTKSEGVSLKQVVSLLAQQSGQNIVVAPDVDAIVHFSLRDVPWQVALDTIVKTAGPFALVRDESGVYRIIKASALKEQRETMVFKLKYIQPPSEYKPKLTSEFTDRRGGESSGSQELRESFTLFKALTEVVRDQGTVEFDYDSNAFIVTTTKPTLDEVADIIRLVDVRPEQVFIDVKFVATSHTDLIKVGVNWPPGLLVSTNGGSFYHRLPFNLYEGGFEDSLSITGDSPTQNDIDVFLNSVGGGAYTFGVMDFTNTSAVLEFFANDSESEILQAPQLTVVDNKPATVFIGDTIHFAEEYSSSAQSGGVVQGIREASKNSPVKVGTQLMVTPHIVPDSDNVILSVIPASESLTGTSSPDVAGFERFSIGSTFIDLPRLSSRTIVTTLMLKDGQTAVLGGLIGENRTLNINKWPILGDIPVLGYLFKHKQIDNQINNLYVFISVRVLRDEADVESLFALYEVPGATALPYKRGMKVKSIEDELNELEAEKNAELKAEKTRQKEEERARKKAEKEAKKAAKRKAKEEPAETMLAPEVEGDVLGKGWEESEHEVEEFVVQEEE
jgi:type II secretory pathway component GspD/PulD (secretin)